MLGSDGPTAADRARLVTVVVNMVVLEISSSRLVVPDGPTHERPRAVPARHDDAASRCARAKWGDVGGGIGRYAGFCVRGGDALISRRVVVLSNGQFEIQSQSRMLTSITLLEVATLPLLDESSSLQTKQRK